MGLDAKFKNYVSQAFPECVVANAPPPDGVVGDAMVMFHSFKPRSAENEAGEIEPEDEPAKRLVNNIWWTLNDATHAALCFDVSANTPVAKEIEWSTRPKPEVKVTAESVQKSLMFHELPDYGSIISSREARNVLCD